MTFKRPTMLGLLVGGLLALQAGAARLEEALFEDEAFTAEEAGADAADPDVASKMSALLKSNGGSVCGGPQIRQILTGDASIERIRNIPWKQVDSIAASYIAMQQQRETLLKVELQGLPKTLEDALRNEKPTDLPIDKIQQAITSAVTNPESYISLTLAQQTKCGGLRPADKTIKLPRDSYDKAEQFFTTGIQKYLAEGKFRVNGDNMHVVCTSFLNSANDENNFCTELCHSFTDIAQRLANDVPVSAGGKTSADLQQEVDRKANELSFTQGEISSCTTARGDLQAFQKQLGGLQETISKEHKTVRDAQRALMYAQQDLDSIGDNVAAQDKTLTALLASVKGAGAKVAEADKQLKTLLQENKNLGGSLTNSKAQLESAKVEVKKAGDAAQTADMLKAQVSALLMKISFLVNSAVRDPIRKVGLGEDKDLNLIFALNVQDMKEMRDTSDALSKLQSFCTDAATKDALKNGAVVSPAAGDLCSFGSPEAVEKDIVTAVETRVKQVKGALQSAKNWLNPYHGQKDMDAAKAKELVGKGEPQGLREIIAIMSHTNFYRNYLKKWKLSEPFHKLFETLGANLAKTQTQQQALQQQVTELEGKLTVGLKLQTEAEAVLKQAIDAHQIEKGKQAEAEKLFNELKGQHAAMSAELERLKKSFADATKRYNDAQTALKAAHASGMALVELLQQEEGDDPEEGDHSKEMAEVERPR